MKKIYLSLFLVLSVVTQIQAQEKITITVSDTSGNSLPYPEVKIGKDFHRAGTINGTIEVPLDLFTPNDSLTLKYIGYKTVQLLLDPLTISQGVITLNLEEESYFLDPIIVSPSEFSSDMYFKKKKKWLLLPCRKYFFDMDFTYNKSDSKDHYTGHMSGISDAYITYMDSTSLVTSEEMPDTCEILKIGKRATEINYLVARAFCHQSERKNFFCTYMGKTDNSEVWEFSIRKQQKMPWELRKDDELRCIVTLDNDGFITKIKTHFTSSKDNVVSYLLYTDFGRYDNQLIPIETKLDIIPSVSNKEIEAITYTLRYCNIRKE